MTSNKSCDQHEVPNVHKRSEKYIKSQITLSTHLPKLNKTNPPILHLNQNNTEILSSYKNLFQNIYWSCKEEIAIASIISLNNFSKDKVLIDFS